MANYTAFTTDTSLFNAFTSPGVPALLISRLTNVTTVEFRYLNADNTLTVVTGTGFVYDETTGMFSAGEVLSIEHRKAGGTVIDAMTFAPGFLNAVTLQAALESESSAPGIVQATLLAGDDLLDMHSLGRLPANVDGGGGNDRIFGGAGFDTLAGGSGDDLIRGNGGGDRVLAGIGDDILYGGVGNDVLIGGSGNDRLAGGDGDDVFAGGIGDDRGHAGAGMDTVVFAGRFADFVIELSGIYVSVTGPDGADFYANVERLGFDDGIFVWDAGQSAWTRVNAAPGLALATDGKVIVGSSEDDSLSILTGTNLNDVIRGLEGNDVMDGGAGSDLLLGGNGNDTLNAGGGFAGPGDRLYGGLGDDILNGGKNDDRLLGEAGQDRLTGNRGNDNLRGGGGADTFVFDGTTTIVGTLLWDDDTIHDFEVGVDHVQLIGVAVAGLGYANDADGNAVITRGADSITLIGVDATVTALTDLLL